MATTSRQDLADRVLGGQLKAYLQHLRDEGHSYNEMRDRLRDDHDITITGETMRRWCAELGVITKTAKDLAKAS